MPRLRAFLLIFVTLLLLLLAGLFAAPGFIDWQAAKPRLEAQLSRALGREVFVEGDLSLRLLPRPWVTAEGLRVTNREGGSEPELLRVAGLEMRLSLVPLIAGRIEVHSMRLLRPVLLLERLGDGHGNWAGMASTALLQSRERAESVRLTSVELQDGEVIWRDHLAGREVRLSGLDGRLSARSLQGPLSAQGRFRFQEELFSFDLFITAPDRAANQRLRLLLELPEVSDVQVQLNGQLSGEEGQLFEGEASLKAAKATALLNLLGGATSAESGIKWPLAAEATVTLRHGEVALNDLKVKLPEVQLEGWGRLRPGQPETFELNLASRFLDLGPLLSAEGSQWHRLLLPSQLKGKVRLEVDRLLWRGQMLERLELSAALDQGDLRIDHLAVAFPGGGSLISQGTWATSLSSPEFVGSARLETPNLRAQLEALGFEPRGIAADRLRRFTIAAALSARPDRLEISDLHLELDRMNWAGGFAIALRERPGLGLRLVGDLADLDAYAAVWRRLAPTFLSNVDANLELGVKRLILAGHEAHDLQLSAALRQGALAIQDLQINDLSGAKIVASGRLEQLGADVPQVGNGHIAFETPDISRFFRVLSLETPPLLDNVGDLRAKGTLEVQEGKASLHFDLAALSGQGRLLLDLDTGAEGGARIDGQLELKDLDLARLTEPYVDQGPASQAATLISSFSLEGEQLLHESYLTFEGASLELKGGAQDFWSSSPAWRGNLALHHPDAGKLSQLLFPQTVFPLSGTLDLEARLDLNGERLSLEEIQGRAGEVVFGGSLVRQRVPQEALELDLFLGEWKAEALAAVLLPFSPIDGWLEGEGRWSRKPLRLHRLRGPNLNLHLHIASLDLGYAKLNDVEVIARRRERFWHLERLVAEASGGWLEGKGQLVEESLDRLKFQLEIEASGVPIAYLRPWLATDRISSGSFSAELSLDTAGSSVGEAIGALRGGGKLEGSLELASGDDPRSRRNGAVLGLLFAEMEALQLWFSGEIAARDGRVTTPQLRLMGPGRRLLVRGLLADLPLRRADFDIKVYGGEGGEELLTMMSASGPLGALDLQSHPLPSRSRKPLLDAPLTPLPAASDQPPASDGAARPHKP